MKLSLGKRSTANGNNSELKMSNGILGSSTRWVLLVVCLRIVCGLPVDDGSRSEFLQEMRNYMNVSVAPCDNFYEFTCGNFPKYHPSTNETTVTNIFQLMNANFDKKVKKLMKIDSSIDTEVEQKVKYFYQSCVKLPETWDVYIEKLKMLADEFGKMPALEGDRWQEENFDWLKTVTEIQYKYNIGTILNAGHMTNYFNNSENAIYIDHFDYPLGAKSVYLDDEHEPSRIKYKKKMADTMTDYLGIPEDVATKTAEDIFAFEVSLVRAMPDENLGLQLPDIYLPTTLEKLKNTYSPVLNITQLVSAALGSIPSFPYYENRKFLENFVKVLPGTPKKTLANFVYYTFLKKFVIKNNKDTKDQEKHCISEVKKYFSSVFENIIYRKYTTNQTHNDLEVMWNNIKLAFEDVLNSPKLNWIHSDVKSYAMEKLHAMKFEVPASQVSKEFIHLMDQWTVDEEDFLLNMKTLLSVAANDERDRLYDPPKQNTEDMGPLIAYTPANLLHQNKITVPVSALQPHYFFSTSLPSGFNFGRLGSALGHELVHGFDDNGRKHDKLGNIREWWDKDSADALNERVRCFVGQYEQYEFGGQKLPRRLNQCENIADNGGLRLAYQAYLKWYKDSERTSQERKLETFPDFPYNNKQLFFISYAQEWCADTYHEEKRRHVASDSHTPSELRAVAALSNMQEFSEEFNCPLGSAMNPIRKCEIY